MSSIGPSIYLFINTILNSGLVGSHPTTTDFASAVETIILRQATTVLRND